MNYYELTYIVSSISTEEDAQLILQKVKDAILEESGKIEKETLPEKRLIHFVKKQESVYLSTIIFQLYSQNIKNLIKKLKSENGIIRYILLKKKIFEKNKNLLKHQENKFNNVNANKKIKKVELKEIDKEIEEMLKE